MLSGSAAGLRTQPPLTCVNHTDQHPRAIQPRVPQLVNCCHTVRAVADAAAGGHRGGCLSTRSLPLPLPLPLPVAVSAVPCVPRLEFGLAAAADLAAAGFAADGLHKRLGALLACWSGVGRGCVLVVVGWGVGAAQGVSQMPIEAGRWDRGSV